MIETPTPAAPPSPMLCGVLPVLATPFQLDGQPDLAALDRLVEFNVRAGVDGLVFPGNASEVEALSVAERQSLTERIAKRLTGRIPFVIGLSSSDPALVEQLALHARQLEARAAMIAPPSVLRDDSRRLSSFLRAVAATAAKPLILQNAPPPLGPGLTPGQIAQLMHDVPAIEYVKEEFMPAGQRISQHLAAAPAGLRGVFGGAAGRFIMDELARGAVGSMPSCETPELHVWLFKEHRIGNIASARSLYTRMLPLLVFTSVFRAAGVKAMLRIRGVIETDLHRNLGPSLDAMDRQELNAIAAELHDLLDSSPHAPNGGCNVQHPREGGATA